MSFRRFNHHDHTFYTLQLQVNKIFILARTCQKIVSIRQRLHTSVVRNKPAFTIRMKLLCSSNWPRYSHSYWISFTSWYNRSTDLARFVSCLEYKVFQNSAPQPESKWPSSGWKWRLRPSTSNWTFPSMKNSDPVIKICYLPEKWFSMGDIRILTVWPHLPWHFSSLWDNLTW